MWVVELRMPDRKSADSFTLFVFLSFFFLPHSSSIKGFIRPLFIIYLPMVHILQFALMQPWGPCGHSLAQYFSGPTYPCLNPLRVCFIILFQITSRQSSLFFFNSMQSGKHCCFVFSASVAAESELSHWYCQGKTNRQRSETSITAATPRENKSIGI